MLGSTSCSSSSSSSSSSNLSRDGSLGRLQIFVKTLTDKTITLRVEGSDTVRQIKARSVSHIEGLPPKNICLTMEGKQLLEDRTLNDHNIKNGTTLQMELVVTKYILVRNREFVVV